MSEFKHGEVVVVSTGQAGTYIGDNDTGCEVFLANGDIWIGPAGQMFYPQSREHLDACPKDVDRFKQRESPKGHTKSKAKAQNQKWTKEFDDDQED